MHLISIREATRDDARAILEVHHAAVHKTACKDYPEDILDEWSTPVNQERINAFAENFNNSDSEEEEELIYVAEISGQIVGFGSIVPSNNELRAVYVSPSYPRRAVGKSLLVHLENIAKNKGVTQLHLDSSLTAEQFYIQNGYQVKSRGFHRLKSGAEMRCIHMFKPLREGNFAI